MSAALKVRREGIVELLNKKGPQEIRDICAQVSGKRQEIFDAIEYLSRAGYVTKAIHSGKTLYKITLGGEQHLKALEALRSM